MKQDQIDYAVIKNAIRTLCVICAGDENKVIEILTGYLFDEEEAGRIKQSTGTFVMSSHDDGLPKQP